MNVTGMIVCHEHYDCRGGVERRDYEWEGGELAYIDQRFMEKEGIHEVPQLGDIINIGPFQLRVIDKKLWGFNYIVARNGWKARLRYVLHRTIKVLDKSYRRLIVTAAVWGLADYHDASIPTWRDVYLLRGLSEWIMRHLHGRLR